MVKQQTGMIQYKNLVIQKIRENYQSIVLGILVLLVAVSVIARIAFQQKDTTSQSKNGAKDSVEETTALEKNVANNKEYIVKRGDNLWMIAQKNYGSGYNAMDIAKANNIKNPNNIEIGMKLKLPEVKTQTPTGGIITEAKTDKVTISEDTYKIKAGDTLWGIALQAYGDGYQWIKIAKANKLSNPDIIHKDNVLNLPR